jgi:hypothetical protein
LKKDITRKHFLHLGIGASAAVLVGCGGDDGDTGAGTDDPSSTSPTTTDPSTSTDPSTTSPTTTSPTTTDSTTVDPSSSTDPSTTEPSTSTDTDPSADSSSGDSSGTTGNAFDCSVDPTVEIGTNHGHEITVTAAEIAAGVEIVYDIQGVSPHPHTVTLTEADFATLVAQGQVVVNSSDAGHVHVVTITCV